MNFREENRSIVSVDEETAFLEDVVVFGNLDCRRNKLNRALKGHRNRTRGILIADSILLDAGDVDGSQEQQDTENVSGVMEVEEYDNNKFKSDNMDGFDPLLYDMLNRHVGVDICEWFDPVIANEPSGWIMALDDNEPKSYRRSVEDAALEVVQSTHVASELSHQRKNHRGRPKKRIHQMSECLVSPPPLSCKEAQNTWDIAKILGISATDEKAILSGLRKSKRLQIMDGKQE